MKTISSNDFVMFASTAKVTGFDAQFFYEYYDRLERTDSMGAIPSWVIKTPGEDLHAEFEKRLTPRVPKFIEMLWHSLPDPVDEEQNAARTPYIDKVYLTQQFAAGTILDEDSVTASSFFGLTFHDVNSSDTAASSVARAQAVLSNDPAANITVRRPKELGDYLGGKSQLIASVTTQDITHEFIQASLDAAAPGLSSAAGKQPIGRFLNTDNASINIQFNTTIADHLVTNSVDSTSQTFAKLGGTRNQIIAAQNALGLMSLTGDTITIPFVKLETLTVPFDATQAKALLGTRIVGYIIEKRTVKSDGTFSDITPMFVGGKNTTNYIDVNVVYGTTYAYCIRAVTEVKLLLTHPPSAQANPLMIGTLLLASKPSSRAYVRCAEDVPPPPPADIAVIWDYAQMKPVVTWNLPPNSQRDIKGIQLFSRPNTSSPFDLRQMYVFDDDATGVSIVDLLPEAPASWTRTQDHVGMYVDQSFNITSSVIYTLCSIDAHGISSDYGEQFKVSFDRFANRIIVEQISSSGAPKAYPNMMLVSSMFVDLPKVQNFAQGKMSVYLTPDGYTLKYPGSDHSDPLLAFQETPGDPSYLVQLIDYNRQQLAVVNVNIVDKRTSTAWVPSSVS